ncbi:MAG: hypothetical protein Q9212_002884 [Teloschistes hypoglaucus]
MAMATEKPASALQSQIFEIIVGPSEQVFFAHAAVLSKSKVLQKAIEGPWKEAQEKKIRWPDRDVDTAARFVDWLYTGDYTYPYPTVAAASESSSTTEDVLKTNTERMTIVEELHRNDRARASLFRIPHNLDACVSGEDCCEGRERKSRESNPQTPRKRVHLPATGEELRLRSNQSLHPLDPKLSLTECTKVRRLFQGLEFERWAEEELHALGELDYEGPLMAHARLYAMASHFMVDNLLILTWQRVFSLFVTMGAYRATPTVIGNLATFVHYVYTETNDPGKNRGSLRDLVTKAIARNYNKLRGEQLDELITSSLGPDSQFVLDLTAMLSQEVDKWKEWEAQLSQREETPPRKRRRYGW